MAVNKPDGDDPAPPDVIPTTSGIARYIPFFYLLVPCREYCCEPSRLVIIKKMIA
jgi:hypothetical protein